MRQPIKKSPRDGTAIILEDDVSGTYDVAHWSIEAGEWVGESGEPIQITPTHWYPIPRDQYLLREDESSYQRSQGGRARRVAVSSIAVTLLVAALIATYFRTEVAAYVTRYAGQEDILGANKIGEYITGLLENQGSRKGNLVAQGQVEGDQVSAPAEGLQAAPAQQIAAVPVSAVQQSLREDRAEGRGQEPAEARRTIEGLDVQLQAGAAKSAQLLEEEREKAAGLALGAATARKELARSARDGKNRKRSRRNARAGRTGARTFDRAAGK